MTYHMLIKRLKEGDKMSKRGRFLIKKHTENIVMPDLIFFIENYKGYEKNYIFSKVDFSKENILDDYFEKQNINKKQALLLQIEKSFFDAKKNNNSMLSWEEISIEPNKNIFVKRSIDQTDLKRFLDGHYNNAADDFETEHIFCSPEALEYIQSCYPDFINIYDNEEKVMSARKIR